MQESKKYTQTYFVPNRHAPTQKMDTFNSI
jgi:hypothetical protein